MLNKRMVLIVIMPQIIPQMMQFQQLHQYQIEVNPFPMSNLGGIQSLGCHPIDFIAVQHQVGCESVMLIRVFPKFCVKSRQL